MLQNDATWEVITRILVETANDSTATKQFSKSHPPLLSLSLSLSIYLSLSLSHILHQCLLFIIYLGHLVIYLSIWTTGS